MKRIICLLTSAMMCLTMFGCVKNEPVMTTTTPELKYPKVSGTFMQPGTFAGYSKEQMRTHLQYMKDVGIELLIVQSTFLTTDKITRVYFEGAFDEGVKAETFQDHNKTFLGNVLAAAKECGIRVYVGLANDGDWWQKTFSDQQWLNSHINLSILGAKQIYDNYKSEYPDTLAGWYFWPEYWNKACSEEEIAIAAEFLGSYRSGLISIDPDMPMLLSPFISAKASTPEDTQKLWTDILAKAKLQAGDIFCCQDSVGAGHVKLEQVDAYFAAMKAAVDTTDGVLFWANNEDFTPDFKSADMGRFLKQLEITHQYTDKHISFAFCHYRNPDVNRTMAYEAYQYYYQTGQLKKVKANAPTVEVEVIEKGANVVFNVTADNKAGNVYAIVITKEGQVVFEQRFDNDECMNKASISATFTDSNAGTGFVDRFYTFYTIDFYGNMSAETVKTVQIYT